MSGAKLVLAYLAFAFVTAVIAARRAHALRIDWLPVFLVGLIVPALVAIALLVSGAIECIEWICTKGVRQEGK